MLFSTIINTACALAAPIASATNSSSSGHVRPAENTLQPLIYAGPDGSIWLGEESRIKLIGNIYDQPLTKRNAVEPKIHLCCGNSGCCDDPCADPCADPCSDPCYDPCADPCANDGCCCADELKASCYTKWFCPSTYCCCGSNNCGEDYHPVVDALRSCCATKWLCPSTYCPCNWDCPCDNSCDPCADPCADTSCGCDPCGCEPCGASNCCLKDALPCN